MIAPPRDGGASKRAGGSEFLGDELEDFGGLAVDIRRGAAGAAFLRLRFRLDCPRHRLIKQKPHRLLPRQQALLDQSAIERKDGAYGRHRICRIVEGIHCPYQLTIVACVGAHRDCRRWYNDWAQSSKAKHEDCDPPSLMRLWPPYNRLPQSWLRKRSLP